MSSVHLYLLQAFLPALSVVPLEAHVDLQPITFAKPDASDVVVEGAAAGIKAGIAVAAAVVVAAPSLTSSKLFGS